MLDKIINAEDVYKNHMCMGCTICKSECTVKAISYEEDIYGFIQPKIDKDACILCGKCIVHCPGKQFIKSDLKIQLSKKYQYCYGHSLITKQRYQSASGGVVTELLSYLLKNRIVDYCSVVPNIKDSQSIKAKLTNEEKVIRDSCGSKYCPVDYSEVFEELDLIHYRYALVMLPCQVAATKKKYSEYADKIFFIALICNHLPSRNASKALCECVGGNISYGIKYRGYGWPGYFLMKNDNADIYMKYRETFAKSGFGKYFYNDRCKLCNNHLGEEADISVGDAYLVPEKLMGYGQSVCIIRTEKMKQIFDSIEFKNKVSIVNLSNINRFKEKIIIFYERNTEVCKELWCRKKAGMINPEGLDIEYSYEGDDSVFQRWEFEIKENNYYSKETLDKKNWLEMFEKCGGNQLALISEIGLMEE